MRGFMTGGCSGPDGLTLVLMIQRPVSTFEECPVGRAEKRVSPGSE